MYPPSHANSRSCRCGRVRPAYVNFGRSRHDNARLGYTRHLLAHVPRRALDRNAVYVACCSSGSGDRCIRLWLSRRSQEAFLLGVYSPSCANSRTYRCVWVRPTHENFVLLRKDNARLGWTRHPLAHVLSGSLDRKTVYVLFCCWSGLLVAWKADLYSS